MSHATPFRCGLGRGVRLWFAGAAALAAAVSLSGTAWANTRPAAHVVPAAEQIPEGDEPSSSFDECIITSADLVREIGVPGAQVREFAFGIFGTFLAHRQSESPYAWEGTFTGEGEATSGTILEVRTSVGTVTTAHFADGSSIQAFPLGDGTSRVIRSVKALPGCAGALTPPPDAHNPAADAHGGGGAHEGGVASNCDDGSVIDILVMWTPRAQTQSGGATAVRAIAEASVAMTNHVYATSLINVRMRAVGYSITEAYTRDSTSEVIYDLTSVSDGQLDSVHALRNSLGADLVALITAENLNYCGIAWIGGGNTPHQGFSVTVWNCAVGNLTFTHEVGHNQGCCHAPGDGGGCTTQVATVATTVAGSGGVNGPKTGIRLERADGGVMMGYPTVSLTVVNGAVSGPVIVADGGSSPSTVAPGGITLRANAAAIAAGVPADWRCVTATFEHGGIFPYSVGHRFNGTSGNQWRTVMAYAPGRRLPRFSSPLVIHDGVTTGVPGDTGADNSRTINETAVAMANYRCSVVPATGARTWIDSGILLPPSAGQSVTIEISDVYPAAAGTQVEILMAATADLGAANETMSLAINGVGFGAILQGSDGTDEYCNHWARSIVVSAEAFNSALHSTTPAQCVITSSAAVSACSPPGELRLAITYVAATDSTDCGSTVLFYADQDNDGFTLGGGAQFCPGTTNPGYRPMRSAQLDCNDASAAAYPGAPELCATAGADNDCDGNASEIDANAADRVSFYRDQDGDTYTIATTALYCPGTANPGWRQQASAQVDCNDTSASIYSGAPELCATAGIDNDCDGNASEIDETASDRVAYFRDQDGDTFTTATTTLYCPGTSNPGWRQQASAQADCNDSVASIYPGAPELCGTSGTDNDCDGNIADVDSNAPDRVTFYRDQDGDAFTLATGAMFCPGTTNAGYRAAVSAPLDCNDASAVVYPGALELCATAGTDNDCDGDAYDTDPIASDRATFYRDEDGDGYTLGTSALLCPSPVPAGWRLQGSAALDCNDTSPNVYPGAPETCSTIGTDNDCDGDSQEALGAEVYYRDGDGDGFGSVPTSSPECEAPPGFVLLPGDCDDTAADIHPGAPELCRTAGTDNDCNGNSAEIDADASDRVPFFNDSDGDGYTLASGALFCAGSSNAGYRPAASFPLDCDDGSSAAYPGAPELCVTVGADNDCDGDTSDIDASASDRVSFFADADGDGYTLAAGAPFCPGTANAGYRATVSTPLDCDDGSAATYPGAPELCATSSTDNDCDGVMTDIDAGASDRVAYFTDADGDAYTLATGALFCPGAADAGYRAHPSTPLDCNDSAASVFPGAPELCATAGIDNDCDGDVSEFDANASDRVLFFSDSDGDGYTLATGPMLCPGTTSPGLRAQASSPLDCDDSSPSVYPGAPEVCATIGVDNDCDGDSQDASDPLTFYLDTDGDGFGDDAAPIHACSAPPGYVAIGGDGCPFNPFAITPIQWHRDADGDLFGDPNQAMMGCSQPAGHIPEDTDCDDSRAWVNPAALERCDAASIDEDCDGLADDQDPSASGQSAWYVDEDADGYGAGDATAACDAPSGSHVARSGDNCPSIPNPLQSDCDSDGYGDACAIAGGAADCDADGIPDACAIAGGAADCDADGTLDACEIASGGDADRDGTLDACQFEDCNLNRTPDSWDLLQGISTDCNDNGVPDDCEDGTVHADTGNLGALMGTAPLSATVEHQVPSRTTVRIRVSARADLDATDEYVRIMLNGIEVAQGLFSEGGSDCPAEPGGQELAMSAVEWLQVLDAAPAPGEVHVQLLASAAVDSSPCPAPLARLTISYGGTSYDCDSDGYSDICEFDPATDDCNANGIFDACEAGTPEDTDSDGTPDQCERAIGDFNLDGLIDGADLAALLTGWGLPNPAFGDFVPDGVVDGADLAFLLGRWGPLP